MKDERILNLQKKIVEKTMERKKQAGLLKIIPQKTRIVSSKVWLLHKEKSSAIDLLFTDLCSTASTGKGQRQMVPYMAGSSNTLPRHNFFSHGLDLTFFSHVLLSQSRARSFHTCLPTLTTTHSSQQHLTPSPTLVFPSSCHTHPITQHPGMLTPLPPKACYSLSFPWFCGVAAIFKSS